MDVQTLVVIILLLVGGISVILLGLCLGGVLNVDKFEPHMAHDGRQYHVRDEGSHDEKKEAANFLAKISRRVDVLVDYMKENQLPTPEIANRLYSRWRSCLFRETARNESSAAYTVNKGDEMRLCVRDKDGLQDLNTGMFVILHELGHVMSISYGHNEEFRRNFSYIVHLASSLGMYEPQNFGSEPVTYCGVRVNTTPCSGGTCSQGDSYIDGINPTPQPLKTEEPIFY